MRVLELISTESRIDRIDAAIEVLRVGGWLKAALLYCWCLPQDR